MIRISASKPTYDLWAQAVCDYVTKEKRFKSRDELLAAALQSLRASTIVRVPRVVS
jgi:hypothetical protein